MYTTSEVIKLSLQLDKLLKDECGPHNRSFTLQNKCWEKKMQKRKTKKEEGAVLCFAVDYEKTKPTGTQKQDFKHHYVTIKPVIKLVL